MYYSLLFPRLQLLGERNALQYYVIRDIACLFDWQIENNTGQQNLTIFFSTRGKISNPYRTFNAEFRCVSSVSPSPTVCL